MADQTLDCKGLMCPMPIVKTSKKIKEMTSGQTLDVVANDKAFEADIKAWSNRSGNTLISFTENDGVFTATIKLK
jgi:TusA-related sulfurtransferase